MRTLKIAALIGALSLIGCTTTLTDCPPVTPIAPEIQQKAQAEVDALPEDSAILTLLAAGLDDRDKLRACRTIK